MHLAHQETVLFPELEVGFLHLFIIFYLKLISAPQILEVVLGSFCFGQKEFWSDLLAILQNMRVLEGNCTLLFFGFGN